MFFYDKKVVKITKKTFFVFVTIFVKLCVNYQFML